MMPGIPYGYSFERVDPQNPDDVDVACIWRNPVAAFAAVSGHRAKRVAGFYDV